MGQWAPWVSRKLGPGLGIWARPRNLNNDSGFWGNASVIWGADSGFGNEASGIWGIANALESGARLQDFGAKLQESGARLQEFWGKAESKNVVDVINQSDAAANDGKSGKLGAPSISAERYLDIGDLQLWYISGFREKTFNDSDAHPSSGVPVISAQYARKDDKDADDFAVRLSSFAGDWDLAGSFFYGTARDPILSLSSDGSALNPYYVLQKSIGFEAQYTGNVTLLKWESLHGTQSSLIGVHDFAAAVMGIEYTYYGPFETIWDIGLIGEIQHDDCP